MWNRTSRFIDWEEIPAEATHEEIFTDHGGDWGETKGGPGQHRSAIDLFTTVFVAVAKRGTVSDDFMAKIEKGLLDDLQHTARLDPEVIRLVYKFYESHIIAEEAPEVPDAWLEDIPDIALCLRLTVDQAVNSGLTSFVIVGRAMTKYPDFLWGRLNVLTQGELANYRNAINRVQGNAYFGFNKSLGCVRSTLYSSLAYVAKELLIQLNGEVSLKRYAG